MTGSVAAHNVSEDLKDAPRVPAPEFQVVDTPWGYIIRSTLPPPRAMVWAQAGSFSLGVCLLTFAVGMLILSPLLFHVDLNVFRMGMAVLLAGTAIYCLWFASRGTRPEVQIDTRLGEVREVILNNTGRPTTVGHYGFETIGGVFLEQEPHEKQTQLVLRCRRTTQTVCVTVGYDTQLLSLRDRLTQDLAVKPELKVNWAA